MSGRHAGYLVTLAMLVIGSPLAAQESVFNLPAFGLPASGESVRARGLGGAGVGLGGEDFTLENPARLSAFERAGLFISVLGQRTTIDNGAIEGEFEDVVFPVAQIVVPAWNGIAFGVGYYQFVDFDAAIEDEVSFGSDTLPVTLASEGAVAVLAPAVGATLADGTRVGVSADVYLGSREIIRSLDVSDVVTGAVATADSLSRDFGAVGLTLGVERDFNERLTVGGSYKIRPTLTSQITAAPGEGLEGSKSDFVLPNEWIVGASYWVRPSLLVSGVVRSSDWSSFEGDVLGGSVGGFESTVEWGAGLEFRPLRSHAMVLGPTAPARIGFRHRSLPIRVGGEQVSEWSASLGYGRGFAGQRSGFDVVFEFGRRGAIDQNEIEESFVRLGFGFNVFEQWEARGGGRGRGRGGN